MTDNQLEILHFVRRQNNKGDPITEDDLMSMSPAFGADFKWLCDDGYVIWVEVAGEIWFYPSDKGHEAMSVAAGQLALPGMEAH